jgi:uncharacterized protein (TIGR02147 family)
MAIEKSIFEFLDYKQYLNDYIDSRPRKGRGFRSLLASTVGCQVTYLSRILNGDAHLSLEQAEKANVLLGHSVEEGDFFILLLQLNRAGTSQLKERFQRQIHEILQKRLSLKNRLAYKKGLNREDQATYYSSWHYSAIHMLLGIPEFQTKEALAKRIGLPAGTVSNILEFLVSVGLVVPKGSHFEMGQTHIYLENDSPMIARHHINWRMQAVRSIDRARPEDLHYSSVITVSHSDSMKIRDILVKAIEQIRPVVRASSEEALFSYAFDFFEVR